LGYFGGEIVFGTPKHANQAAIKEDQALEPKVKVSFVDVSDIFNHNCIICHKSENPPLGLPLGSYEHVTIGSEKGPVVIPRKPDESKLVLRIKGNIKPSMPFGKPLLPGNSIQTIVRWIEEGAPRGKDERAISVREEKPGKSALTK
jgi:Planctomycete cytochrome C